MSRTVDARTKALVEPVAREIRAATSDPKADAVAEREQASFDANELAVYMQGGQSVLDRNVKAIQMLKQFPWGDKSKRPFLTRTEEYVQGLEASVTIWKMANEGKITNEEAMAMRKQLNWPAGLELHLGMFIPSLLAHGTKEQQEAWLPPSLRLEMVGTYAQTELGHGTFVRGLETVAVFDPDSDEFVVHSPTLTSTKWWPGGLGKTATHVILMARLISRGKDHGVHSFVVQIRDMARHTPLPGVTVGDIGPKMGYNGVDNGFLRFDHLRIPRSALLARFARLERDGTYVPPPSANAKASYATMVFVRADIVKNAGDFLGRAVTIATRYTAVRRQTAPGPGARELQVLDYDNVQQVLLPLLARAYALSFMGRAMFGQYKAFDAARARGDFSALPELHALSSGLKAACTDTTSDGIETARRTCGGHGFSQLSALPTLFTSYVQNATWEGDNNVMYLQAARFLVRALITAQRGGRLAPSVQYLADEGAGARRCGVHDAAGWRAAPAQVEALTRAARHLAVQAAAVLRAAAGGELVFEGEPWNGTNVDLIRLAKAHSALLLHRNFLEAVEAAAGELKPATTRALRTLCQLHGVTLLVDAAGDLLEAGYINSTQAVQLRAAKRELVRAVRPDAVALTDGFGYEDYLLSSALGRKDGDVYQALLEAAQGSPLNDTAEGPAWHTVLKAQLAHSKL
ncbi:ACX1 [Auxenochlorella protothecoides x Auxenochlorella symbiontica]